MDDIGLAGNFTIDPVRDDMRIGKIILFEANDLTVSVTSVIEAVWLGPICWAEFTRARLTVKTGISQAMGFDHQNFSKFASEVLNTNTVQTSPDDDKTNIFHASLDSLYHSSRWIFDTKNSQGRRFQFDAGFVDIFEPNAFADKFQSHYFLGMHSSLFVSINEFALFCFAQRDFFSDVGDASQEVSPKPWDDRVPGLWLIDYTKDGRHVNEEHSRALIPRDSERFIIATCLALLMARFVWHHELAHGFNGHVDFIKQTGKVARLYELSPLNAAFKEDSSKQDVQFFKVQQQLEFDADQSAFWGCMQVQLGHYENIELIKELDQNLRLRLTLFACYVMPWLFEQYEHYIQVSSGITHPIPINRLRYLFRASKEKLLSQHPELININNSIIAEFDNIRSAIPSVYTNDTLAELFRGAVEMSKNTQFDRERDEIINQLQQFQFSQKHV